MHLVKTRQSNEISGVIHTPETFHSAPSTEIKHTLFVEIGETPCFEMYEKQMTRREAIRENS